MHRLQSNAAHKRLTRCQTQIVTCIHPLIESILCTYYVPGPILGTGANTADKSQVPVLMVPVI